jgi:GYF domain 2
MHEDTSQSDPGVVWHLSRDPEHCTVISDQALRALAALGKLRPNDLLWRSGFESWRSALSMPGLLAPPPLPTKRSDQTLAEAGWLVSYVDLDFRGLRKISTSIHRNLFGWSQGILLLGRDRLRLSRFLARSYGRKANRFLRQGALKFETLLSRTEHPRVLAGIIASWVLVGTINILMHESEADAQLAPQNVAHSQTRSCTTTAAVSPNPNYSKSSIERDLAGGLAFNIVNFQLAEGVNPVTDVVSKATPHSDPAEQDEALDPIPLPTRKPASLPKPFNVTSKAQRVSQAARRGETPKPLRFGTIGFAYSNQ